mmetsp:Transcript_3370/g.10256  ORF Transcript_3370/g.10256 Transcript_3370/m.10256 type:complete len:80 (+) Transcript_3370:159-398(+)
MVWQFYQSNYQDGKYPGWHNYSPDASGKLEHIWLQSLASGTKRTTWHLKSGVFSYEINLRDFTQMNMATGKMRPIRRIG